MPRRDTFYRSLTAEFRRHLTQEGQWPDNAAYRAFMKDNHDGAGQKVLTDIRAGAAVPEKAVIGLLDMICNSKAAQLGSRAAVSEFVATKGFHLTTSTPLQELADVVAGEPMRTPLPASGLVDYLKLGVRAVWSLFEGPGRAISSRSRPCTSAELPDAIRWLVVHVAYHLSSDQDREAIGFERAAPVTEARMGIGYGAYLTRAREWRNVSPLIVRIALGRRYPAGVSIVLPLTPAAYEAVRSGTKASRDCTAEDFCIPSQHLFLEACSQRVAGERIEPINGSLPLLATLLTQLGHLSELHGAPRESQLNMLSFAGTDLARDRLAHQGFQPTGACIPDTDIPLMERVLPLKRRPNIDGLTVAMLRWISEIELQ